MKKKAVPHKTTTVRIPTEIYERIVAEAKSENKTINNLYNQIIKEHYQAPAVDQIFSLLFLLKSKLNDMQLSQKIHSEFFIQYVSHYFTHVPDVAQIEPPERKKMLQRADLLTEKFIESVQRKLDAHDTLLDSITHFTRSSLQLTITKLHTALYELERLCVEASTEALLVQDAISYVRELEQCIQENTSKKNA